MHVERAALCRHLACLEPSELGKPLVGEAKSLQRAKLRRRRRQPVLANPLLAIDDLLDLADEPGIDAARIVDLLLVEAESRALARPEQAVGGGRASAARMTFLSSPWPSPSRVCRRGRSGPSPSSAAPSAATPEGAADGHGLADRFHRGGEHGFAPGNFSKAKRGILVTT